MLLVIGLAAVWGLGSSCGGSNPTPPQPLAGFFSTDAVNYECTTGVSPLEIVRQDVNGGGIFVVDVTGDTPPFFNFARQYDRFSSEIDCPFGTNCCAFLEYPDSDSYVVTMFFNEAGNATCLPPGPGLCFRWFRQESFASGFTLDCAEFFTVNQISPDGFIGPCS